MGAACSTSEEAKQDKALSKLLKNEEKNQIHKLLLLGPGESGKSTIFKQANVLFNHGFEKESEREQFKPTIHANCIEGIKKLVVESHNSSEQTLADLDESVSFVMQLQLSDSVTPMVGRHISRLWSHNAIRETYSRRAEFQLGDSVEYFLEQIDTISQADYIPTTADIIRSRVRTSGIVEKDMAIGKARFKVVDVGGQRGERRKWIHCFQDVQAIIFVCAISEYNQKLMEDESTNRLLEGFTLFKSITAVAEFAATAIIAFLNKSDLFAAKLRRKEGDLRDVFPHYQGGYDLETATDFIKEVFRSEAPLHDQEELLYFHVTCATNPDNMAVVFEAVEDIVTRQNLQMNELY